MVQAKRCYRFVQCIAGTTCVGDSGGIAPLAVGSRSGHRVSARRSTPLADAILLENPRDSRFLLRVISVSLNHAAESKLWVRRAGNGSGCSFGFYILLVTVEPFEWRATNPTGPKECKYAYAEWTESADGRCLRPMKTETIDDGGSFFPHQEIIVEKLDASGRVIGSRVFNPCPGVTLRDWFAGQALAGQLASMSSPKAIEAMSSFGDRAFEWAAKSAYNFADAMILARKGAKP